MLLVQVDKNYNFSFLLKKNKSQIEKYVFLNGQVKTLFWYKQ